MSNAKPEYRFGLKGAIVLAGYETTSAFAEAVGYDVSILSRVIRGWTIPSPTMIERMAKALSMTPDELGALL